MGYRSYTLIDRRFRKNKHPSKEEQQELIRNAKNKIKRKRARLKIVNKQKAAQRMRASA